MGGKQEKRGEIYAKCFIYNILQSKKEIEGGGQGKRGRSRECKVWQVKGLDGPRPSHNKKMVLIIFIPDSIMAVSY